MQLDSRMRVLEIRDSAECGPKGGESESKGLYALNDCMRQGNVSRETFLGKKGFSAGNAAGFWVKLPKQGCGAVVTEIDGVIAE